LEQRRDGQQDTGPGHGRRGAEHWRRILQPAQRGHQPVHPAVGRIMIEGQRDIVSGAKSGQVWSAPPVRPFKTPFSH